MKAAQAELDDIAKCKASSEAGERYVHRSVINAASIKRASMDLTRSLADLRRGREW